MAEILAWRHPKPRKAEGRCIGRTDLKVDPRKARRLARRIQRYARREGLPQVVWTSPLQRCANVARWLRSWGWQHCIDEGLLEIDFGQWEGKAWNDIPREEVDAWVADFLHYQPGGGEALQDMLTRAEAWQREKNVMVVAHAGWMNARRWLLNDKNDKNDKENPHHTAQGPNAANWPASAAYNELWHL